LRTPRPYRLFAVFLTIALAGVFPCWPVESPATANPRNIDDQPEQPSQSPALSDSTNPLWNQGPKAEATGERAMVVTQTPLVTETALQVLRDGGNAFDAFITAVLLQQVTEPHMVSHFGVISGVLYDAATGTYQHFDGIGERPLAGRANGGGDPMKVSIGGTVKALESIWKRYGTRPWESYFDPAIRAAEEGVLVTSFMYGILYAAWENPDGPWPEGVRDLIDNEEAREFYMPGGFLVPVGQRWRMPQVAEHLRRLASEGADYVYTGDWGRRFVEESNRLGGAVTMQDMAEYEVIWSEPLRTTYNGYEIITEPPPVYGGLMVAYNLNILRNFDLESMGHFSESPDALEILVRTSGRVFHEVGLLKDPRNFHTPVDLLLSDEYGKAGAEFVRMTRPLPDVDLKPRGGGALATAASAEPGDPSGMGGPLGSGGWGRRSSHDSEHNVIVDEQGNWISSLHSGHGGTPGVFIDGIEANGSDVPSSTVGPGRRLLAYLAATIVAKDGVPILALGTPGLPPQPVTEVLVNILEYGMHPKAAAEAPRFWQPGANGSEVRIESRISDEIREELPARGIRIVDLGEFNWHTGSFQIIWRDLETGLLHGVSDPRRLGYAAGF
jgi:gamma-glutamyltranspeptidase/glutathione hydrolase